MRIIRVGIINIHIFYNLYIKCNLNSYVTYTRYFYVTCFVDIN